MIKRLLAILLLVIFVSPPLLAETVTASVDKTEIIAGETITLTITAASDSETFNTEAPDLEPLKNLFQIIGMQDSTQTLVVNGQMSVSHSWLIALTPKTDAKGIIIPPLQVGNTKTKPITIKVIDTSADLSIDGHDVLKIETSLEKNSAYIQQQLILTLRIYLDKAQVIRLNKLIEPTLQNIDLQPLDNHRRYDRQINGILYEILERDYAVSPQTSGTLTIPSFALVANVREHNIFQDKTITSDELTLQVKPKPASYPSDVPWLPAKQVTLTEQWNKTPDQLLQGDTILRTLIITADGLTSKQIGSIPHQTIAGLRSYPEQPKLLDNWSNKLPIGTRSEEDVLIPLQTGKIVIPEIKLAWWNTETDKLEYASAPEHTLHVAVNPALNNIADTTTTPENTNAIHQPASIIKRIKDPHLWLWQLFTAIFALSTVIGFSLWFYARKQPAIIKPDAPAINPKTLLDDIKKACQENDPQQTRIALDNWVKQQSENLTELLARYVPLAEAVDELNKVLYSETSNTWQGDKLWQAIQSLPAVDTTKENIPIIPPLYPK